MSRALAILLLLFALTGPARAEEDEAPAIVVPQGQTKADDDEGGPKRHVITRKQHDSAVEAQKTRARAEAAAKAKAQAEAKAKAEAEAKAKAEAEEAARQRAEAQAKTKAEKEAKARAEAEAEQAKRKAVEDKRRAEMSERERRAEAVKERLREETDRHKAEKLAEADKKQVEAEARRITSEQARELPALLEAQRRLEEPAASGVPVPAVPTREPVRTVLRPGATRVPVTPQVASAAPPAAPAVSPAPAPELNLPPLTAAAPPAYFGPKAKAAGLKGARSLQEAQADPRFAPLPVVEDAQVKVVAVGGAYTFFEVPQSGCPEGHGFILGDLVHPFDGQPSGAPVVIRVSDPGEARTGVSLAFPGLRRGGKGLDGTFVYCSKGAAFPVQ